MERWRIIFGAEKGLLSGTCLVRTLALDVVELDVHGCQRILQLLQQLRLTRHVRTPFLRLLPQLAHLHVQPLDDVIARGQLLNRIGKKLEHGKDVLILVEVNGISTSADLGFQN